MALVPLNVVAGEFTDSPNNYRVGAVVQVKTTGGSFASIYADAAGTTVIPQDGSSNITDSTGSFSCYVAAGFYDVTISSITKRINTGAHDDIYTRNFKSITDLRAQTDASGNVISLAALAGDKIYWRGYYAESDGGSNWGIVKVGNSTAITDDGGSIFVIVNDSANGVWVEANLKGKRINVKKFGAKGDGVANDHQFVQKAANYGLGRCIYFPQGTYRIESTILQDTTGLGDVSVCKFVGQGMSQTVIDNQSGAAAFKVTSGAGAEFAYNLSLSNMTIKSTGSVAGTIGLEMLGCRFVKLTRVKICDMALHGVYGYSSIGDLTDTAHVEMTQIQIENCGGYGIYAKTEGDAIQYNWNIYESRIGLNGLGGILAESLVNSTFKNSGIYYNSGFGVKITTGTGGAPSPSIIKIDGCEFDTNEGVQIDLDTGHSHKITSPYLIDNNLTPAFTKGIRVGSCQSIVIEQATPRMHPSVTGKVVVDVSASASDVVIRDSDYNGWSVSNGTYYVDNTSGQVTIDDRSNRNKSASGTYTVQLKDTTLTKVSPTTVTGVYSLSGKTVTVGFRNLNNLDLTAFSSDIIGVTLPIACKLDSAASFLGQCIITSDAGASIPMPTVANGGQLAIFQRAGDGAALTSSDLTASVSGILNFTLTYQID